MAICATKYWYHFFLIKCLEFTGFFSYGWKPQKPTLPHPSTTYVCVYKTVGHKTKDTKVIFPFKSPELEIKTKN